MEYMTDILVEFALAAKPLIVEDTFFDTKDGKPQAGTKLINDTIARIAKATDPASEK